MTETSTPEPALPAPGPGASPFWAAPVAAAASATGELPGDVPIDVSAAALAAEPVVPFPREAPEATGAEVDGEVEDQADDEPDETDEPDEPGDTEAEDAADAHEPEEPVEEPPPSRFEVLVDDRLRRAHYAHHLTRAVFTPEEAATAAMVERRAAVWVPTMTFVATVVSAIAAVVLATRLRSDPTDPDGNQLVVVTVTVCLLAAAFATLLRAEVHYERLRPTGRVVRHDVADAYEVVRDAPRRLVQREAPVEVLRRVVGLLPAAEQLVEILARYARDGGTRVRQHPAYERILRMRAEVEALEAILDDVDESVLHPPGHDAEAALPKPHQVADFDGLADLAAMFTAPEPAPGAGATPSGS